MIIFLACYLIQQSRRLSLINQIYSSFAAIAQVFVDKFQFKSIKIIERMPIWLIFTLYLALPFTISIKNCQHSKIDSHGVERCTICFDSYNLNLNYTKCSLCKSADPNCIRCDQSNSSSLTCQICQDGYHLSQEGKCINTDGCFQSNCLKCPKFQQKCQICNQGFFLDSQSFKCLPCKVNNQIDQGNNLCACDFGTYLDNQQQPICKNCLYPCLTCQQQSKCTQCMYGYYMKNVSEGICELCLTPNCIICENSRMCLNCTLGYLLVEGKCQVQLQQQNIKNYINLPQIFYFCMPGCFYCYKYDFCLTCLEGYSRDLYTDQCKPCSKGCKRCESLRNMNCFDCYEGYRLNNNICEKCDDNFCLSCIEKKAQCTKCMNQYTVSNGKCKPCAHNCLKCDEQGEGSCDQGSCYHGYARINNSSCVMCALGCYSCNTMDISTCISCPSGSFQILGGQCQICPISCTTCTNSSFCTACRENYRLINNQCYQDCDYPCLLCSPYNKIICTQCYDGYMLSEDMTCRPDISCNSNFNCSICPIGFYLNLYTSVCQKCDPQQHCIKCQTESSKCAICQAGYYLIENKCKGCSSNCLTCQLQSYCFNCKAGFYLDKQDTNQVYGTCMPCSEKCLTCIDEEDKCNSCTDTEELIGFQCISAQNIIFKITMQHSFINSPNAQQFAFIKQIVPFTRYLASLFGPPYETNPQLLYLKDISSGSIQVSYMASLGNMDPRILMPKISESLESFTKFHDFQIIKTEIVANGFQDDILMAPPSYYFVLSLIPTPFFFFFLFFALQNFYNYQLSLLEEEDGTQKEGLQIRLQPMETQKNIIETENNKTITL